MNPETPPPTEPLNLKSNVFKCQSCNYVFRAPVEAPICKACNSGENIILATPEEKRAYNKGKKKKPEKKEKKPALLTPQSPQIQTENQEGRTEAEIHEEDKNEFKTRKKPELKNLDIEEILEPPQEEPPGPQIPQAPAGPQIPAEPPGLEANNQEVKQQDPGQIPGNIPQHKPGFKIPLIPVIVGLCCLTLFFYWRKSRTKPQEDREEKKDQAPRINQEDYFNPPGF